MRIARVERSVAYNPTDQQTASGDWGAPGKALQGFGKSISDFSGALIESQNQEDDFKTKLALTNFHGQQQQDYENYRANYTGKPEDFQSGWNARYGQAWSEFAPTLPQNPRSQRNAALYGAQLYNNFNSHAQNTQLGMVHAAGVAQVESTINGSLAQLDAANPDQVPGAIDQAIRGVNAMIDAAPPGIMTPADKARLRSQTATLALSRLEKYFTDRGIDPVPAMQETMKRWAADPALQGQRPAMPGPTSAPGGAPGGKPMDIAKQYLGMDENQNTTALASFFRKSGGQSLNPSETAWCAAFVNAALGASGSKGTGSLLARDFLKVGTETKSPSVGDIVVLSRGDRNGWQGHVGFYAGKDGNGNVLVLGGNQGNKVSVASYPAARVLGYRVPPEAGSKVSGLDLPPVGPEPSTGGISATATAYSPKAGGDAMEGGYASARPGPDGKSEVRTLADVASGRSQYVTLAGDKSQDGKTYIIPEITFRDAAGKEQTLKNVKGVVHDTGSAFRGRGDQAFDIPADRDLPDGGASQPYSKQKITFIPEGKAAPDASKGVKVASADGSVPETAISAQRYTPPQNDSGIPRDPEREHYRLDGDASTKARQLREIIASGRQDIVHQLDNQGNDVVAAKPSDKPVWHVNAVTKDEKGNVANALDKGDQFSGPGWAKDTITDWRAGRISAKPNSATANPNSGSPDMESANAASMNPMGAEAPSHGIDPNGLKYMKPSVQSEMMQAIVQKWHMIQGLHRQTLEANRTSYHATIADDVKQITATGKSLFPDDNAVRTWLDSGPGKLTTMRNQVSKYLMDRKIAMATYEAISPLAGMNHDQAAAHMAKFLPPGSPSAADLAEDPETLAAGEADINDPQNRFSVRQMILGKALKAWHDIEKKRIEDPAASVAQVPSVAAAASVVRTGGRVLQVGLTEGGDPAVGKGEGPSLQSRNEMLVEARLAAQDAMQIGKTHFKHTYGTPRTVTLDEAKDLLRMPDPKSMSDQEIYDALRAAQERVQVYGRYAPQVFKDALALTHQNGAVRDAASMIVGSIMRGSMGPADWFGAPDQPGWFSRQMGATAPTSWTDRMAGSGSLARASGGASGINPAQLDQTGIGSSPAGGGSFSGAFASPQVPPNFSSPTAKQKAWIKENPDQWAIYDSRFGRGAAMRDMKGGTP